MTAGRRPAPCLWKRFHSMSVMADLPTIYDVARSAGVGIATVSRVINGEERVRPETRLNVLAAIKELNYRPNRAARRLAGRVSNRARVAVLLPFFTASFYFGVSRAIARDLAGEDFDLVLFDVTSREHKNRVLDRLLAERGAEAVILVSVGIGVERRDQLERLGIPVVAVDRVVDGIPSVAVDNRAGGRLAVEWLQTRGCRRLGLIGGPVKAEALRDRELSFRELAGAEAAAVRAASVEAEAGRLACMELLDLAPDLDGLVCVNDLIAVGALKELRARGRLVPSEVQVIGFDDQPMIDALDLTTVRQPVPRMGRWAVRAVTAMLAGRPTPESQLLPLTVVERGTTLSL